LTLRSKGHRVYVTKFGVNSSSRFSVRGRENKQRNRYTDVTECPIDAGGYTAGMGNNVRLRIRLCLLSKLHYDF